MLDSTGSMGSPVLTSPDEAKLIVDVALGRRVTWLLDLPLEQQVDVFYGIIEKLRDEFKYWPAFQPLAEYCKRKPYGSSGMRESENLLPIAGVRGLTSKTKCALLMPFSNRHSDETWLLLTLQGKLVMWDVNYERYDGNLFWATRSTFRQVTIEELASLLPIADSMIRSLKRMASEANTQREGLLERMRSNQEQAFAVADRFELDSEGRTHYLCP
jgi:hypothetical protein